MLYSLGGQAPSSSLSRVIFAETEDNHFSWKKCFSALAEDGRLFDAVGAWRSDLRADMLQVPEGFV